MDKKFKISKVDALIYISTFACFKIDILSYASKGFTFFYLLLELFCAIYFTLKILSQEKLQIIDIATVVYCSWGLISTIFNSISLDTWLRETIRMVAMIYALRWGLKHNPQCYIHTNAIYIGWLTIINTIVACIIAPNPLLYDNGVSPIFILGGDNTSVRIYILAVLFSLLAINNKRRQKYFAFLVWVSFVLFSWVRDLGTGKICVFILTIGSIVYILKKRSLPKNTLKIIGIVNVILFFILIVVNNISAFSYVIVKVLHRDLTLTARTVIWNITIKKIAESPILGNGYVTGKQFESMLPGIIGVNAHNTFLMMLYMGGIILLLMFVITYLSTQKVYDAQRHKELYNILPIAFMAMLVRSQVEGGDAAFLFFMCHFIYRISKQEQSVKFEKINNRL